MNRSEVAPLVLLGGLLAAMLSLPLPIGNYRDMRIPGWFDLSLWKGLIFFNLGVYTTALVVQRRLRQEAEIEPIFLLLGAMVGPLVTCVILWLLQFMQGHQTLAIVVLFATAAFCFLLFVLGTQLACQFKRSRSNANAKVLLLKTFVLLILTLPLIWLHYGSFPALASAEVRQQWAYQEFDNYKSIVETISTCQPIVARVGNVKFVAPTFGRNYVYSDPGSSGHEGRLTLEVVGETGVGVANLKFHIFTGIGGCKFTYQNRTEQIGCPSSLKPRG